MAFREDRSSADAVVHLHVQTTKLRGNPALLRFFELISVLLFQIIFHITRTHLSSDSVS